MSVAFAHWSQCLISQLLVKIVYFFQTIPGYANIDSSSDHDIVYFCLLSLYASGLDDCLYWDKLRWNDITLANLLQWLECGYLTSLVDIWIECQPTSWLSFSIASGDVTETQDVDVSIIVCLNFWVDGHLHSTTGAVDIGHGSLSPLFMMKVMAWHFVRDTHKVMTKICGCGVSHNVIEMYCIHVFPSIC
jgi:hypothetical protein